MVVGGGEWQRWEGLMGRVRAWRIMGRWRCRRRWRGSRWLRMMGALAVFRGRCRLRMVRVRSRVVLMRSSVVLMRCRLRSARTALGALWNRFPSLRVAAGCSGAWFEREGMTTIMKLYFTG